MIRNQSFIATAQEIVDFSETIDVVNVNIVGDPHSGKTTLGESLAHMIHKLAKIPYTIRKFNREDLLNFKEILKTLTPTNQVLIFGDVSFLGADATKKQLEFVKMATTQIRHLPGGKDVKIISIKDFHYLLGLDKYLRQADFNYITTVGTSDITNLNNLTENRHSSLISDFRKYRFNAVKRKVWKIRISRKEYLPYLYRNPFIPVLFYNGESLRMIVSPTRQWIDPICSICTEALSKLETSKITIQDFTKQGETNFSKGNFLAAVKLLAYVNGLTVYGNHVVQALRWIEKARSKNEISLEQLVTHYGLEPTKTKLRKPQYESNFIPGTLIEAKDE